MSVEWGQGRIEANALANVILAGIDRGLPISRIYSDLVKAGRVTMSRPAFYRNVQKLRRAMRTAPAEAVPIQAPTDAPTTPKKPPTRPIEGLTEWNALAGPLGKVWDGDDD